MISNNFPPILWYYRHSINVQWSDRLLRTFPLVVWTATEFREAITRTTWSLVSWSVKQQQRKKPSILKTFLESVVVLVSLVNKIDKKKTPIDLSQLHMYVSHRECVWTPVSHTWPSPSPVLSSGRAGEPSPPPQASETRASQTFSTHTLPNTQTWEIS